MRDKDSSGHSSHNDVVRTPFWMSLSLLLVSTSTPPAPPNPPTPSMERRYVRKRSSLPRHCLFFYSSHRGFLTFSDTVYYYKRLQVHFCAQSAAQRVLIMRLQSFLNPRNTTIPTRLLFLYSLFLLPFQNLPFPPRHPPRTSEGRSIWCVSTPAYVSIHRAKDPPRRPTGTSCRNFVRK